VFIVNLKTRTYLEYNFGDDEEENVCIIYKNSSLLSKLSDYSLDLQVTPLKIKGIQEYFKFYSYKMPIKSIISYKKSELELFIKQLSMIINDERTNKHELYKIICNHLSNL
jgi:hypothetical protein